MKALGKLGVIVVFFLLHLQALCQKERSYFPLELGLHVGGNIYQGDLTPSPFGSYKTMDFTAGAHVNIIINDAFSFRANANFGTLSGDDLAYGNTEWRKQRNLRFNTKQREYSGMIVWDLFGQNRETKAAFAPYIFAGIGYTFLNVNRDYSKFNRQFFLAEPRVIAGLDADLAQKLPTGMRVLPFGIGLRKPLNNFISVKVETTLRLSSTDYLDGFSNVADTKQTDHYHSHVIGLIFTPGRKGSEKGILCPVFK